MLHYRTEGGGGGQCWKGGGGVPAALVVCFIPARGGRGPSFSEVQSFGEKEKSSGSAKRGQSCEKRRTPEELVAQIPSASPVCVS